MLNDLLDYDLDIVFCGTAAGKRSAEMQQYFAGQGNRFWNTLNEVGLTPRKLEPAEYKELLSYGIGLTDLVKHKSGMDKNLETADFASGRERLRELMLKYRPRTLCFVGKKAAKQFLGVERLEYGLQEKHIGETSIFVTPSTSGAAGRWWDIEIWKKLAELTRD